MPLDALVDVWFREHLASGVSSLDRAVASAPLGATRVRDRPYLLIASTYARAGRADRARAVLARRAVETRDTSLLRSERPLEHKVLGEIALAERRPLDAVKEFSLDVSWPTGPIGGCQSCRFAELGRAYDRAGVADSAIAMFQRYVQAPNFQPELAYDGDPLYLAGIEKRLGELYEAKGDRARAASYYTRFIDLWKSADAELQPKVADMRKRLARLTAERG